MEGHLIIRAGTPIILSNLLDNDSEHVHPHELVENFASKLSQNLKNSNFKNVLENFTNMLNDQACSSKQCLWVFMSVYEYNIRSSLNALKQEINSAVAYLKLF